MPKVKVPNYQARDRVQALSEFQANNIFGQWVKGQDGMLRYVVFSYGQHWPMFIYDTQTHQWFSNASKYSRTTSKHHGQAHPHTDTTPLHVDDMVKVAHAGITAIIEGEPA